MAVILKSLAFLSFGAYAAAALFSFLSLRGREFEKSHGWLAWAAVAFNALLLFLRGIHLGRPPFDSGADFLLLFALLSALFYLLVRRGLSMEGAGVWVLLIAAALIMPVSLFMGDQLTSAAPLPPALRSPLLSVHVFTAAAAYGGFALSAGLGALRLGGRLPEKAHPWIPKIVAASFFMLTFTIVLGAYWAELAWGSYWSWDPKETWALVTWIIYAIYLHSHKRLGERAADIMLLIGLGLVIFTFFGVNYLLSGLHSYA